MKNLEPGTQLDDGKYRILSELGKGGMGVVLVAEHTTTLRKVAIKCLRPGLAVTPDAVERLTREAVISARVRHPNVVDIYDVGRDGELVYLVMELLEGETLGAAIERANMPMHELIALVLPAMRGVLAAHRQGIVHRDIKPDNIFLARVPGSAQLVPKVLDFGISKLKPSEAEERGLTKTGTTLGTPSYMSCEQLNGEKDVDERADVYAFGVILYEALTGKLPFTADSYNALVIKVVTSIPASPKELRGDIPTPLARLVLWAMARDRNERIGTLEELIKELQPFATEHGFRSQMTRDDLPLPKVSSYPPKSRALHTAKAAGLPALLANTPRTPVATPRMPVPRWAMVAIAAGLVAVCLLLWLQRRSTPQQPATAARLVSSDPPLATTTQLQPAPVTRPREPATPGVIEQVEMASPTQVPDLETVPPTPTVVTPSPSHSTNVSRKTRRPTEQQAVSRRVAVQAAEQAAASPPSAPQSAPATTSSVDENRGAPDVPNQGPFRVKPPRSVEF